MRSIIMAAKKKTETKNKKALIEKMALEYMKVYGEVPRAKQMNEMGVTNNSLVYNFEGLVKFTEHMEKLGAAHIGNVGYLPQSTRKSIRKKDKGVYIITSHQNNTDFNKKFLDNLLALKRHLKAELLVLPTFYETRIAQRKKRKVNLKPEELRALAKTMSKEKYKAMTERLAGPSWSEELNPYYVTEPTLLTDNIEICAGIHINATAEKPLSGFHGVTGERSSIVAHPKISWEYVPTPPGQFPKLMMTTGSVSNKNYTISKAGAKGAYYHKTSALVIYTDGDAFYPFLVEADNAGSFYHLEYFYENGERFHLHDEDKYGLVLGDLHCEVMNEGVFQATWGDKNSLCKILPIETQVLHDVVDFNIEHSHHNKNDLIYRYALKKTKIASAFSSIKKTGDKLEEIIDNSPHTKEFRVISSNHHDHLYRFLNETPLKNISHYKDMFMYVDILKDIFATKNIIGKGGVLNIDNVLKIALSRVMDKKHMDKLSWVGRNCKSRLFGIDVSQHGDRGPNGARGSIMAFSKTSVPNTIGHSHTPGIHGDTYQGGHCAENQMNYNPGYSSNAHVHVLTYPNGKRTPISIVNKKWRP
jgi:hypothetical protein